MFGPALSKEEREALVSDAVQRLEAGEIVEVVWASWCSDRLSIGDFRDVGMSERVTTRDTLSWFWRGPGTIKVGDEVLTPMTSTEEVDADWS
jgi:hypothetical protein